MDDDRKKNSKEDSIAILSNKSAKDLKENLRRLLKNPNSKIEITIELI